MNNFNNSSPGKKIVGCNYLFPKNFQSIAISIASAEDVLKWSYGEVKKSETINYRKLKPERGGLFCAKIFGPVNDFECLCKRYKKEKFAGIVCSKCGVLVTSSKVRRYRMGHILLNAKIIHPWFLSFSYNNPIGSLLGISKSEIDDLSNFKSFICIKDSYDEKIKKGKIVSSADFYKIYANEYDYCFESGGDAIYYLLNEIDLKAVKKNTEEEIKHYTGASENVMQKLVSKLSLVQSFIKEGSNPKDMILSVLPVLPADLRPLVSIDGGRFASADINDLYKKIINRNNRLKRLQILEAPRIIIDNEKSILTKSIKDLLEPASKKQSKNPKKSISDAIKGKQGIFRKNLLGKRCDFSGRAVIVPGPNLKLDQCGLPRKMMLKLFAPVIYRELQKRGLAINLKDSKRIVEDCNDMVWPILDEISKDWPVILNRAPTLHKLSMQAFKPIPVDGSSIRLHPLVCSGFNADFDGDQMAVHLPLSSESIEECRNYMMSIKNVILPSNGTPVVVPTKDIVLGIYYLTLMSDIVSEQEEIYSTLGEIYTRIEFKDLSLHKPIRYLVKDKYGTRCIVTTPGRIFLWECIPNKNVFNFDSINKHLKRSDISDLVTDVYINFTHKESQKFLDDVKELGFKYITQSGISISHEDAIIPEEREFYLAEALRKNEFYKNSFNEGYMTEDETKHKIIDNWVFNIDKISDAVIKNIQSAEDRNDSDIKLNNIYMMIDSGARGSKHQIQQLCGIRGIMAKPSGEIHDDIITSNLKIGLNQFDYFDSTHGERKGLSDLALKTSKAGYFTRRLVDCAHGCYIDMYDCGSKEFLSLDIKEDLRLFNFDFTKDILGRTVAEDILDRDGNLIIKKNDIIDFAILSKLSKCKISHIKLRSITHCLSEKGLCALCYGFDISTLKIVDTGLCVGIIAAQSIGEPGTQLTMRTIHLGGAISSEVQDHGNISKEEGIIDLSDAEFSLNSNGENIITNYVSSIRILNNSSDVVDEISLKIGTKLLVSDKQTIAIGQELFIYDSMIIPIIAANEGYVKFHNMIEDISFEISKDEHILVERMIICNKSTKYIFPYITITSSEEEQRFYNLPVGTILLVKDNQFVKKGDFLGKIFNKGDKAKDITGGLPKVIDIFEARKIDKKAIIAHENGKVNVIHKIDGQQSLINIIDTDTNKIVSSHAFNLNNLVLVQDGFYVKKGDQLTDGTVSLKDMLKVMGINYVIKHLIATILNIYGDQGVTINYKHIEIIIKHMLKKVLVISVGDLDDVNQKKHNIVPNSYVNFNIILKLNRDLKDNNKEEIKYENCVFGITKIASDFSDSFISSASFQNTIKVLVRASIKHERDYLVGTKERVILGRPILKRTKTVLES